MDLFSGGGFVGVEVRNFLDIVNGLGPIASGVSNSWIADGSSIGNILCLKTNCFN